MIRSTDEPYYHHPSMIGAKEGLVIQSKAQAGRGKVIIPSFWLPSLDPLIPIRVLLLLIRAASCCTAAAVGNGGPEVGKDR